MQEEAEACQRAIAKITRFAVKTVRGLYEEPFLPDGKPNPKYNRDADVKWSDCSVKTRASLRIVEGMTNRDGAANDGRPTFGVIVLQGRASSADEWERDARKVHEDEVRRTAIDVEAEPK
jgi:hypothetical protein